MHDFLRDVRFAFRTLLLKNRALTLVCVLALGLGIGANTAIFSVIDAVLLRPLPYQEPERLVRLYQGFKNASEEQVFVTAPDFVYYRDHLQTAESLACLYTYREEGFDLTGGDRPERVLSLRVSSGFFRLLGAEPELGREFTLEEERQGTRLAVVSHRLWQRHLDGDPDCLGKSIVLDGESYTVIGIMPQEFLDLVGGNIDVWVPQNLVLEGSNDRGNHFLSVLGRLKPGVSLSEAQAELDVLNRQISEQFRDSPIFAALIPLYEDTVGRARALLYVLLGAVALLLLIACVNVANLFLARSAFRAKEIALRTALGSSRWRLVRQLLTEGLTVAMLGGAAGLLLAWWGTKALAALQPDSLPRVETIAFDSRLLTFNLAVTFLTTLLFGLLPAWKGSRPALAPTLGDASRGTSHGASHGRLRGVLVTLQVALAVVLLIGAGLLMKSFFLMLNVDLGFNPRNVATFIVHLPDARYGEPAERRRFYETLRERTERIPGVVSAGGISKLPASGRYHIWGFNIEGRPRPGRGEPWPIANIRCVDGNYFTTMQIPLLEGRLFDARDHAEAPPSAIISKTTARRYWENESPLGAGIRFGDRVWTVVGVVQDTRHDVRDDASRKIYVPHEQFADDRNWAMTQVVRTDGARPDLMAIVGNELAKMDSDLVVHKVRPLDDVVAFGISQQRFAMTLMSTFSGVALLLAAIGVYGVLSFFVGQRTQEIGIRVALGAQKRQVGGLVVGQGLRFAVLGVVLGLASSYVLTRYLSSLVFEVSVTDPTIYLASTFLLVLVATIAGVAPARRAIRVEPIAALRYE